MNATYILKMVYARSAHRIFLTGLFILASFILLSQCSRPETPQNQSHYSENGFPAFVDSLKHAIATKDTSFVFGHTNTTIFNGFGHSRGRKVFKRIWNESIDDELMTALELGTAYDSTTQKVYAPHYFVVFPDSLDAFSHAYILQNDVSAYPQPDPTTSPQTTLSKGLIEVTHWSAGDKTTPNRNPAWAKIKLQNGNTAYLQRRYLHSPIDYRFWFEKRNDQWYLMGWAAGD